MTERPGSLEDRVERTLHRRADEVAAPISLPPQVRGRVRRRTIANALGTALLALVVIVGSVLGVRQIVGSPDREKTAGNDDSDRPTAAHPAFVSTGLTDTLAWRLETWPSDGGNVATSLWWGSGDARFRITERVFEADAELDVETYLPAEVVDRAPGSAIAWGTVGASADHVRILIEGCHPVLVQPTDITWMRIGGRRGGVRGQRICGQVGGD